MNKNYEKLYLKNRKINMVGKLNVENGPKCIVAECEANRICVRGEDNHSKLDGKVY